MFHIYIAMLIVVEYLLLGYDDIKHRHKLASARPVPPRPIHHRARPPPWLVRDERDKCTNPNQSCPPLIWHLRFSPNAPRLRCRCATQQRVHASSGNV